jgi:two-component system sensor histidine kinase YesM
VHTERFGTFDKFPSLSQLKGDYSRRTMHTGTSIVSITAVQGTALHWREVVSAAPFQESMDRLLYAFVSPWRWVPFWRWGCPSCSHAHRRADPQPRLSHGRSERGNLQTKEVKSRIWEFAQLEHSFNIMVKQIVICSTHP